MDIESRNYEKLGGSRILVSKKNLKRIPWTENVNTCEVFHRASVEKWHFLDM